MTKHFSLKTLSSALLLVACGPVSPSELGDTGQDTQPQTDPMGEGPEVDPSTGEPEMGPADPGEGMAASCESGMKPRQSYLCAGDVYEESTVGLKSVRLYAMDPEYACKRPDDRYWWGCGGYGGYGGGYGAGGYGMGGYAAGGTGAGGGGGYGYTGGTGGYGGYGGIAGTGAAGATGSTGGTGATGGYGAIAGTGAAGATGSTGATGPSTGTGGYGADGATGSTGSAGTGAAGYTGGTGGYGAYGSTGGTGGSGAYGYTGGTGSTGGVGGSWCPPPPPQGPPLSDWCEDVAPGIQIAGVSHAVGECQENELRLPLRFQEPYGWYELTVYGGSEPCDQSTVLAKTTGYGTGEILEYPIDYGDAQFVSIQISSDAWNSVGIALTEAEPNN